MLRNIALAIALALFSANIYAEAKAPPKEDLRFESLYDATTLTAAQILPGLPEGCTPTGKDAACHKKLEELTSYLMASLMKDDTLNPATVQACRKAEEFENPACQKLQATLDTTTQDYLNDQGGQGPLTTFYPFVRNTMAEVFADSLKPTLSFGKECTAECQTAANYWRGYFTAYMYAALSEEAPEKLKQFQTCVTKADDSSTCDASFTKARSLTQAFNKLLMYVTEQRKTLQQ